MKTSEVSSNSNVAFLRTGNRLGTATLQGIANLLADPLRLASIACSVVFFHYFPYLMMVSYMAWEGFFSYDMFEFGSSGVVTFYWWTEFIVIVASMYFCFSASFIARSVIDSSFSLRQNSWFKCVLVLNVGFIAAMAGAFLKYKGDEDFARFLWLLLPMTWVSAHLACLVFGTGKQIFVSLATGMTMLVTLCVANPGAPSLPYSYALQMFGIGGRLPVKIELRSESNVRTGKLVLLTPNHIYLYEDGKKGISCFSNTDLKRLAVANLSGFGHH